MQGNILDISQGDVSSWQRDIPHAMAAAIKNSIYERLSALRPLELSEAAWAREAKVSSSFFQDVRKGRRPRVDNLEKVLEVIGLSPAQFWALDTPPTAPAATATALASATLSFRPLDLPRDIPVMGSVEGGEIAFPSNGHGVSVESIRIEQGQIIDYFRRPPSLANRRDVYGLEMVGFSMQPRYYPGDPIFVDPRRAPQIGDSVVVQLVQDNGDDGQKFEASLIKTLVTRSASFVELEQYNPAERFRIDKNRISAIHRVIPLRELFGI